MDAELKNICELFLNNYNEMLSVDGDFEKEFILAGAAIFTAERSAADMGALNHAGYINKEKNGILADYRSKAELFIRCKMALCESPEGYYELLMDVCPMLQTGKLYTDINNILSAILLIDGLSDTGNPDYAGMTERVKEIYAELTGGSKSAEAEKPYAVIAALFSRTAEDILNSELTAKDCLKKGLKVDNVAIKAVSRCVALFEGDTAMHCERLCSVARTLKKLKHSMGQGRLNVILALAAGLGCSEEELTGCICEAEDILKQVKPFKGLTGLDPDYRRLFSLICSVIRLDPTNGEYSRLVVIMAIYSVILKAARAF